MSIKGSIPENELLGQTLVASGSGLVCSSARFIDRLETSIRRSRRSKEHTLLILVQLGQAGDWPTECGNRAVIDLMTCRLRNCVRSSDSLCDLGGFRFAILLDDIREPSVVPMVLEKLNATLTGAFNMDTEVCRPPVNLGASLLPVGDMPVNHIWSRTEVALEQAVAAGPGRYSISSMVTGRAAMEEFELNKDLYTAYRNNEFEAVYQPVINTTDKRAHACEVLLRWRHPRLGCLYPDSFLPLLEESGLIVPVGEWLLNKACHTARKLLDDGHAALRVCVNISSRQLADRGFLLSVLDALYDSGLDPHALQLEFSEQVLIEDTELVQRVLPELSTVGVGLAVDHFGAGETPLAELVRLPINLVKLDCALVSCLPDDAVSRAIAVGTIALATATDMDVAAVGVEQQRQASVLEQIGCCEAQGGFYFKPVSGDEISAVLYA